MKTEYQYGNMTAKLVFPQCEKVAFFCDKGKGMVRHVDNSLVTMDIEHLEFDNWDFVLAMQYFMDCLKGLRRDWSSRIDSDLDSFELT